MSEEKAAYDCRVVEFPCRMQVPVQIGPLTAVVMDSKVDISLRDPTIYLTIAFHIEPVEMEQRRALSEIISSGELVSLTMKKIMT